MKIVKPFLAPRRLGARGVAAVLAMTLASISQGGQTDIAATPIASTTAALVKPNIMLLMDASGSMARTHMPDEIETMMGPTSVGYKSSQCNTLYYDPSQIYPRPKKYDGSLFPLQVFDAADGAQSANDVGALGIDHESDDFVAHGQVLDERRVLGKRSLNRLERRRRHFLKRNIFGIGARQLAQDLREFFLLQIDFGAALTRIGGPVLAAGSHVMAVQFFMQPADAVEQRLVR